MQFLGADGGRSGGGTAEIPDLLAEEAVETGIHVVPDSEVLVLFLGKEVFGGGSVL